MPVDVRLAPMRRLATLADRDVWGRPDRAAPAPDPPSAPTASPAWVVWASGAAGTTWAATGEVCGGGISSRGDGIIPSPSLSPPAGAFAEATGAANTGVTLGPGLGPVRLPGRDAAAAAAASVAAAATAASRAGLGRRRSVCAAAWLQARVAPPWRKVRVKVGLGSGESHRDQMQDHRC